jgi:glutamine amidotransferase
MQTVVVVDYGMSNLRSVAKALEFVSADQARIQVSGAGDVIEAADRIVFPGQGAIGNCMRHLIDQRLDAVLRRALETKPFLGICLGLQTLMQHSQEDGGTDGLGVYPGEVVRFSATLSDPSSGERLKIPHMGWNHVLPARDHPLWTGIEPGSRFYFVHSYYVVPQDGSLIAGTTDYGIRFTSAIAKNNVFAVQFHPEKSQKAGLRLLANFLQWTP